MAGKDNDFLNRLLATFRVEAEEHLNALSSGVLELEKAGGEPRETEILETVFREAHSLKGAARAVNMAEIEEICQTLESLFAAWKRGEISPSTEIFDTVHRSLDSLKKLLAADEEHKPRDPIADAASQTEEVKQTAAAETVRVYTAKLDSLFRQVEELLSAKLAARQRVAELKEIRGAFQAWKGEWVKIKGQLSATRGRQTLKGHVPGAGRLRSLDPRSPASELLERSDQAIAWMENKLAAASRTAESDRGALARMVDGLVEDAKTLLMLPFSSLLQIFPKLVRDLSRDRGKEADCTMRGAEIEIDRRILEEMKDPLIHLVRNSIDHGIEKPGERVRRKKPRRGTITIAVAQKDSGRVEIVVADDGAGIDPAKVRSAALKMDLVSEEETRRMSPQETFSLIFRSGVSTSPMITDISGRGLGLAIVQEKVEKLGGVISVETEPDSGTTFRVVLPLTLATFRGILLQAKGHLFVMPTSQVERTVNVKNEDIATVENKESIRLNGTAVALVRLEDALGLVPGNSGQGSPERAQAVVVGSAHGRIAFLVDQVTGEQEVLVKTLGKQLSRVRLISGATVLGTGKIALILNVHDLMKSAAHAPGISAKPFPPAPLKAEEKRKSVLVAEDSITARTLLKGILEAAGYDVRTAVDGIDALAQLRSGAFDLLVSDVDMPGMGGLDLTAKIRAERRLSELPVVLVTALESPEDRARGIDVGADAYIVKSDFDQSNLLDVVRRLI